MSTGTKASTEGGRILDGDVWRDFCKRLADAGEAILRPEAPATALDRAEGFRYLTRLLRIGLVQNMEAADPDFPFFYRPGDEYTKYGGDNPDNIYWSAMVRGDRDYKITATRGTINYFSIGSKAFLMEKDGSIESTGELNDTDLKFGPDGKFEILVSSKKQPGHWLPMTPQSNFLLIRQTFLDRKTEKPGEFKIERIGGPSAPAPLDPAFLETALRRTADFVHGNARKFGDWILPFTTEKNSIVARDQDYFFRAGGDPMITYLYGYFDLAPDEAWVINVKPPKTIFWNFSLYNWWNESFDYMHRPVTINNFTGKLDADGSITTVVAASDAGVGNWLDTAGHRTGLALYRWYAADGNPQPTSRVVKLADLKAGKVKP